MRARTIFLIAWVLAWLLSSGMEPPRTCCTLTFAQAFERGAHAGYLNHTLPRRISNGASLNKIRLHPANKYD
jgi:hypothetical protein